MRVIIRGRGGRDAPAVHPVNDYQARHEVAASVAPIPTMAIINGGSSLLMGCAPAR